MAKGAAFDVISRHNALLSFLAERGDGGAFKSEICEKIYGREKPDDAFDKMFKRDCDVLRELLNERWTENYSTDDEPEEIEIWYDRSKKKYFLRGALFFMFPLSLSVEEAHIVSSGIKLCKHFITSYSDSADRLSKKMRDSIPGHVIDAGESLSESLTMLMPVSNTHNPDVLKIVLDAINQRRALKLTDYEDIKGKKVQDVISPYFLYFKYHSWYVWAASKSRGNSSGPFRLSRMKAIETLENPAEYADVDILSSAEIIAWISKEAVTNDDSR
jgi:predicted DNA-binding transcriptional regulator YafY